MHTLPDNIGPLHFVGIGGIGMSGIAEILDTLGYVVQGSDLKDSANVKRLRSKGVHVHIGHDGTHILDKDGALPAAVIRSSAVKDDNPEIIAAREQGVPVVRRAEMLAELMRLKHAIAIGGTHGKTTTTMMIGEMLEAAGFDPTVVNGGIVNAYGTNVRLGKSHFMVAESDESDGTFTKLPARVVVVTNMDAEHMEHYGTFDNVRAAYHQFITNIPFYGYAVLCTDHPDVQALIPEVKDRRIITYGFNPQADVRADNIRIEGTHSVFDVHLDIGNIPLHMRDMRLPMLGRHNVQNALAALAIAYEMGADAAMLKRGLAGFSGVKRRFTRTGEINGVTVIDDYAHHPVEIETVLKTARSAVAQTGGKVVAVMQPHRYSRLNDLFDAFCGCFHQADTAIIAPVYAAGEDPIDGINHETLAAGIKAGGHKDVRLIDTPEEIAPLILESTQPGDMVILMGAGDITAWAYDLPGQLEARKKSGVL